MLSQRRLRAFAYITMYLWPLHMLNANLEHVYCMLIPTFIMEMVYNGAFTAILKYVHTPYMKLENIYFPAPELPKKEEKIKVTVRVLTSLFNLIRRMNHGWSVLKNPFTVSQTILSPI
ncbi:hypothetical protein D3C78_1165760 [compost metagenome]